MTATPPPDPLQLRIAALLAQELDPGYRRRVATVMRWLPPSPEADSHILDVGCGRGFFVRYYAMLGQHALTGIELDPAIVRSARRLNDGAPNTTILRADAAALPLPANHYSGAVLSEVLEHVPDDLAVLAETWRVLRPGAVAAITVPHKHYPWAWDPINRSLTALHLPPVRRGPLAGIWAEHLRLYDIAGLRDVVRRAGFLIEAECAILRHCLPFSHNLIYGIGKPLLESGWLPAGLSGAIDRQRRGDANGPGSRLARALRAVLAAGEPWNRDHEGFDAPSVNLCLKARKPGAGD